MYNHNKAQQSKTRVHISWDILYDNLSTQVVDVPAGGNNTIDLTISGSPTDIEK